jgi:hypothetical protein
MGKSRGDVRFLVAATSPTGRGSAAGFDSRHDVALECWNGLIACWFGCDFVDEIKLWGPATPVPVGAILRDLLAAESCKIAGFKLDLLVTFDVIAAISCSCFRAGCPWLSLCLRQFITEKRRKDVA